MGSNSTAFDDLRGDDVGTCDDSVLSSLIRFALDNATISMFTVDPDGRFVEVNDTACRNLEYTREQLLRLSVPDVSLSVTRETWPQRWQTIREAGKAVFLQEHKTKSGRRYPVEVAASFFEYQGREFICACVNDLTERMRVEESLCASERYNRALFEQSPVGQSLCRLDGVLVDVNQAYAKILGRSATQLVGQPFLQFTPQAYHRQGKESLVLAQTEGGFPAYEKKYVRPDGTCVSVRISGILLNRDGQPLIWCCVQDITEEIHARNIQKESQALLERRVEERTRELTRVNKQLAREVAERRQTEQALADAKSRLLSVLSSNPMLVYSYRVDTDPKVITFVSENSETETGYPAQSFLEDPDFWINHVHPDDREWALYQAAELVEAGSGSFEYRFLHGDGTYRWIRDTVRVSHNEAGYPAELVGCWNDVTQQKKAEQLLRLVQSAMMAISEAVMITDTRFEDGGPYIEYVNPAFVTLTGYTGDEVVGKPSRLMRGYGADEEALKRLQNAIREGKTYNGQVVNYHRDRTEYAVKWQASPIRDGNGVITHWLVVQEDITQQLQDQDTLRKRELELEHVMRLSTMGEMASGIAHELNQPLTAIHNYARGALRRMNHREDADDSLFRAMEHISVQAERSGQIIRRMRQFVSRREPRRSSIEVRELIRDVLVLFESDLRSHSTRVEQHISDDLPILYADHIQIEQVLLNLLRNATAAMQDNKPDEKVIDVYVSADAKRQITLSICDRGCGLTDEQLQQIFDPFFTTKRDGIGMGLTISQTIIEMHGGRLIAEPRPGGGMCFKMILHAKG